VPIVLLLLTTPGYGLFEVPASWVLTPKELESKALVELPRESRLVGFAMLVGVIAAAASAPRVLPKVAASFFEGAGYGYTHVISLIVAAQCFGKGIEGLRLDEALESVLTLQRFLLLPMAAVVPLAFAWLSGSGMASTASLYGLFLGPTQALGADPLQMGAVMSIASAAGRTLSPVSAVALMSASLTQTDVFTLTRNLLLPLLAATAIMVLIAMLL
jgi:DcuC family C4-dicarboxylate transporter